MRAHLRRRVDRTGETRRGPSACAEVEGAEEDETSPTIVVGNRAVKEGLDAQVPA